MLFSTSFIYSQKHSLLVLEAHPLLFCVSITGHSGNHALVVEWLKQAQSNSTGNRVLALLMPFVNWIFYLPLVSVFIRPDLHGAQESLDWLQDSDV